MLQYRLLAGVCFYEMFFTLNLTLSKKNLMLMSNILMKILEILTNVALKK